MNKQIAHISLAVVILLILTGCNYPVRTTPSAEVDLFSTSAARTVEVQQTSIAQTDQAERDLETPTSTLEPTEADAEPTSPPEPSSTPSPTSTQTTQAACDQAAFVAETIPDGTNMAPGEAFTKTWTLQNTGACTWNANYDVVFVSGAAMGAPAAQQLTSGTVAPGDSVQIQLELTAPNMGGTHRGEFKLRNADGVLFGIGEEDATFWVEIEVDQTVYNFVENYCASEVTWTSSAGDLPCPGTPGNTNGWVIKLNEPRLENGVKDNEPAIAVHPAEVNDGWIRGTFPEIPVSGEVFFRAILGCNYDVENCDVNFKLNYKIDGGTEHTLGTWHEVQDGDYTKVNLNLSSIAGKDVQFILLVEANGTFDGDEALWFMPRIEP